MKQTPLILAVLVVVVVVLAVAYKMGKLPYFKPAAAADATAAAATTAPAAKSTFAGRLFGPGGCMVQDDNGAPYDRCLHV